MNRELESMLEDPNLYRIGSMQDLRSMVEGSLGTGPAKPPRTSPLA